MPHRIIVLALLAIAATGCLAQKLVEEDYWRLEIKPLDGTKLDKLSVDGAIHCFFLFELKNPDANKRAIDVDLMAFCISDVLREGVDPEKVREFNRFRVCQLPKEPADAKEEFDNTEKIHYLRRFYDRPNATAKAAILRKLGDRHGEVKHLSEIGKLEAGASVKAMAIFPGVDPRMDYCGVTFKGLENRIKNVGADYFMEDGCNVFMHHTPGSPTNFLNKEIIAMKTRWVVMKRERIVYPEILR